uniref:AFC2 n=1 Tax=Arundo donax TaxID=35708 RepID=A0A0A9D7C4_ARUDO
MECLAEMPRAPLDRRPRKRQRLGWDVGPAEFHQIQLGFCGQEVANAISAVALGLSSGGVVSSQENQEAPRLGSPPLRADDKDGHYVFAVGDNLTSRYKINAKMGEGQLGLSFTTVDTKQFLSCIWHAVLLMAVGYFHN